MHINSSHFALNIVAAISIYLIFSGGLKLSELLLCCFSFTMFISLALLCLYPQIEWYRGLSGLLHALVAYFAICLVKGENNLFWMGFLALIWAKVLLETVSTHSGYESLLGDIKIITEAHLVGVLIGTIVAIARMTLILLLRQAWRQTSVCCLHFSRIGVTNNMWKKLDKPRLYVDVNNNESSTRN